MADFITMVCAGRLVRTPVLKNMSTTVFMELTVAVNNNPVKGSASKPQYEPTYIDATLYDKLAERLAVLKLEKGVPIVLVGDYQTKRWIDEKSNAERSKKFLNVRKFFILSPSANPDYTEDFESYSNGGDIL